MPGTHTDTWLLGLTWVVTLLSLVGLLSVAARLVAWRLLVPGPAPLLPLARRGRPYPTVVVKEQLGENQRSA